MSEIIDMVKIIEESKETEQHKELPPSHTDPKWVDYIISLLADHELIKGAPTTDGLRRVTEKVYGSIIFSDSEVIEVPGQYTDYNYLKATVKHTLHILRYSDNQLVEVSACVDVVKNHIPNPFCNHLVGSACTRAEGKALRRALKIRIQTVEELTNINEDEKLDNESINDQQESALKVLCERNDINLEKFVKSAFTHISNIKQLKNDEAKVLIKSISELQKTGSIPENIAGYQINWKETFGG